MSSRHDAVLRVEAAETLVTDPSGAYVDATFGAGGHSREVLGRLGPDGRLLALDADQVAATIAGGVGDGRFEFAHSNYRRLDETLAERGVEEVDGVLMDLGISSMQVDDAGRGFSFGRPGPLDMRMDRSSGRTLGERLARVGERELARVIWEYGEERRSRSIASRIIDMRDSGRLRDTADIARACGGGHGRRHQATRVFLALRIWVNEELDALREGLAKAAEALRTGGRLVVITFHSLEDRIVKRFIRPPDGSEGPLRRLGRLVRPSQEEVAANHRARSAIMRVGVKA